MAPPDKNISLKGKKDKSYLAIRRWDKTWSYTLLAIGAFITLIPFMWMLFTSLKPEAEVFIFPPRLLPHAPTLEAYNYLFEKVNFGRTFFNSLVVTLSLTFTNLFFCSLAGYAFAKIKFIGRDRLFYILLATMMIPGQVTMIPSFIVLKNLGLLNNFMGLILPGSASVFGIFLVRQFMEGVPDDLIDAARIDGCSEFRVYWSVVLPLLKPVLATIAIFTFMAAWNDFLWPLIVMTNEKMYTLPVALSMLNGEHNTDWTLLMAGAVIVTTPVLIVFFVLQKYFIRGIAYTGLKG